MSQYETNYDDLINTPSLSQYETNCDDLINTPSMSQYEKNYDDLINTPSMSQANYDDLINTEVCHTVPNKFKFNQFEYTTKLTQFNITCQNFCGWILIWVNLGFMLAWMTASSCK